MDERLRKDLDSILAGVDLPSISKEESARKILRLAMGIQEFQTHCFESLMRERNADLMKAMQAAMGTVLVAVVMTTARNPEWAQRVLEEAGVFLNHDPEVVEEVMRDVMGLWP